MKILPDADEPMHCTSQSSMVYVAKNTKTEQKMKKKKQNKIDIRVFDMEMKAVKFDSVCGDQSNASCYLRPGQKKRSEKIECIECRGRTRAQRSTSTICQYIYIELPTALWIACIGRWPFLGTQTQSLMQFTRLHWLIRIYIRDAYTSRSSEH